ncbi:hypothetical protein WJX84_011988 [Apatococcus fuscideae]|uniref:Phosphoglycerate mutase n=1 Tax=Apatococcus fuscideae TaxID=2026836 RepID=A0AAW1TI48_9CHLO
MQTIGICSSGNVHCPLHSGSARQTARSKRTCRVHAAQGSEIKPSQNGALIRENHGKANYHAPRSPFYTGGMDVMTAGAAGALVKQDLHTEKTIVIVRHGLATWSAAGRIQGSSNESELTDFGKEQAERVRDALTRMPFDSCFTSPLTRARQTAEIVWSGRQGKLIELESLAEAYLGFLQGMENKVAAKEHAEAYRCWRSTPAQFTVDGRWPVDEVFFEAKKAWQEMLLAEGATHLVVTHKSIARALLCVALGILPTGFRAIDVHNGGICIFRVNKKGEPMLINLNLNSHMHQENIHY